MTLIRRLLSAPSSETIERFSPAHDFGQFFTFNGNGHPLGGAQLSMDGTPREALPASFDEMVHRVHHRSGPVSAAVYARALLVSQLRFRWLRLTDSDRTMFGSASLAPLERPGGGVTRPELLIRIEQDASYAGNAYVRRLEDGSLRRLRPDWVELIIGSDERPEDVKAGADAEVVGYAYRPGPGKPGQLFTTREVAHFKPDPHPGLRFIGESWISSIVREVLTHQQANEHVSNYFEHSATPNLVLTAGDDVHTPEQFAQWVELIEEGYTGVGNAWRNLYLAKGADASPVGSNLKDLDMSGLTGGFETMVAVRSRIPAPILGIREGMQGSSLTSGNYGQTRRNLADMFFSPYAEGLCAALESIIAPPPGGPVELSYDPSRIRFLQEDEADAAAIMETHATTAGQLFQSGWDPDAIVDFLAAGGDFAKLRGQHNGLPSVQTQPGTVATGGADD